MRYALYMKRTVAAYIEIFGVLVALLAAPPGYNGFNSGRSAAPLSILSAQIASTGPWNESGTDAVRQAVGKIPGVSKRIDFFAPTAGWSIPSFSQLGQMHASTDLCRPAGKDPAPNDARAPPPTFSRIES